MRAAMLIAVVLPLTGATAHAGGNNSIYIKQESPGASQLGNTLSLDQSEAGNSIVLGPSHELLDELKTSRSGGLYSSYHDPEGTPLIRLRSAASEGNYALQRGEGNSATLILQGNGGQLQLLQDTSPGQFLPLTSNFAAAGNTANATLFGSSLGVVIQQGQNNIAQLGLNRAEGLISQAGNNLRATLNVDPGGSGQIVQVGSDNSAELTVYSGAAATYTQIGRNMETVAPAAVEVFTTNPGNITITQTGL